MDKRYGLILIIIFISCINLFLITNTSEVVGSASAECGNYIFSLPPGFNLYDSAKNYILIHDDTSGINIYVYSKLEDNDTYYHRINEVKKEGNTIVRNGTISVGKISVKCLYYTEDNDIHQNRSEFYFKKNNHTFKIVITDFDLDTEQENTIDYVSNIITSMKYNYKKYN